MKILIPIVSWASLGFFRGVNLYNYKERKDYFYTDKMLHGIGGSLTYLNPILFFPIIYKEMFRLEVKIRGLEKEKSIKYYELF